MPNTVLIMFDEAFLNELITCPKLIVLPQQKDFKTENKSKKNDIKLISEDKQYSFSVFIRQNTEFTENFSIGLSYIDTTGKEFKLIRFNGNHGENKNRTDHPHFHYHIHTISIENLNNGSTELSDVSITDKYAAFEDALLYFFDFTNIREWQKYFPSIAEPKLL